MTFPIIVRIPQSVLAACYQIIPRPVWEPKVYWLCLCSIVILLLGILTYSVFEAYRLYNDVKRNRFYFQEFSFLILSSLEILVYGKS